MASPPYIPVSATAVGSDAVATLPPVVYARRLTGLTVNGPQGSAVEVYIGTLAPSGRIDQNPNGYSNTAEYPNPRPIPPGASAFCRWPNQAANVTACSATFILDS